MSRPLSAPVTTVGDERDENGWIYASIPQRVSRLQRLFSRTGLIDPYKPVFERTFIRATVRYNSATLSLHESDVSSGSTVIAVFDLTELINVRKVSINVEDALQFLVHDDKASHVEARYGQIALFLEFNNETSVYIACKDTADRDAWATWFAEMVALREMHELRTDQALNVQVIHAHTDEALPHLPQFCIKDFTKKFLERPVSEHLKVGPSAKSDVPPPDDGSVNLFIHREWVTFFAVAKVVSAAVQLVDEAGEVMHSMILANGKVERKLRQELVITSSSGDEFRLMFKSTELRELWHVWFAKVQNYGESTSSSPRSTLNEASQMASRRNSRSPTPDSTTKNVHILLQSLYNKYPGLEQDVMSPSAMRECVSQRANVVVQPVVEPTANEHIAKSESSKDDTNPSTPSSCSASAGSARQRHLTPVAIAKGKAVLLQNYLDEVCDCFFEPQRNALAKGAGVRARPPPKLRVKKGSFSLRISR
jgi:hypothetical protein